VGDLAQPESLRSALAGCDAVMHVAADYRLWIRDPAAMYRINVDGTRELLRLARETGVPRFVYTSQRGHHVFFSTDGSISDEDTPVSLHDMVGHYKRSKFWPRNRPLLRQKSASRSSSSTPPPRSVPTTPAPRPPAASFVDFLNKKFPAYMDTGLNLVDVAEIARTHVAALTQGTPGRRYNPRRRKPDA